MNAGRGRVSMATDTAKVKTKIYIHLQQLMKLKRDQKMHFK